MRTTVLALRNLLAWALYGLFFLLLWLGMPALLKPLGVPIWNFSRWSSALGLALFGIRVRSTGAETLTAGHSYILLANHSSWFDQLALCVALRRRLHFVANEKYFHMPILKYAMRLYEHIPVAPQHGRALRDADRAQLESLLASGRVVVAYPEGTRSTDGDLLPFKKGMFKIAAATGIPVVPVWISGAAALYPRKAPLLSVRSGLIRVHVGAPSQMRRDSWVEDSGLWEAAFRARGTGGES